MSHSSLHTAKLQDWIRRIQAGDPTASEELVRAATKRLERLARRMLRDFPNIRRVADSDDVFQESVVRLLRTLRQLDQPPASVRQFLALAATHIRRELLDLARRCNAEKRRGDVTHSPDENDKHVNRAASGEDCSELESWRRFHEEAEKLPMEEREVVSLRFYHGWSEAEIAELFGVSQRTVHRRWNSGCTRLVQALGGELPTW